MFLASSSNLAIFAKCSSYIGRAGFIELRDQNLQPPFCLAKIESLALSSGHFSSPHILCTQQQNKAWNQRLSCTSHFTV